MAEVTIDNVSYDLDTLSDEAKAQLTHVHFADAEIQRLQLQLALAQTARNSYFAAVKELLPKKGGGTGLL